MVAGLCLGAPPLRAASARELAPSSARLLATRMVAGFDIDTSPCGRSLLCAPSSWTRLARISQSRGRLAAARVRPASTPASHPVGPEAEQAQSDGSRESD